MLRLPPSAFPLNSRLAACRGSTPASRLTSNHITRYDSFTHVPHSITPDRRRIVEQEIARATQRVVRIGRLRHRWTGVEVVVLVARRTAATERAAAAARRRAGTAVIATAVRAGHTGTAAVVAQTATAVDVAVRVLVAVAAPRWRAARRAIVRGIRIAWAAFAAAIPVEGTAVAAGAAGFQVAAAAATAQPAFGQPQWPRCIAGHAHMARLGTRGTRIATRLTAFRTNRLAANGRQRR